MRDFISILRSTLKAFSFREKARILSVFVLFFMSLLPLNGFAQQREALRDSLKKATEALEYHPDSVDLRLKKAAWNLQLEQWQYAKDEYDRVLSKDQHNIAALYYRAFANQKLGRYNFARLDYEHLLQRVPGHFSALLGLALLNQKDKHHTEALNQINLLVSQHADSAVAYAARAGIEVEQGMLELGEYDYSEAIKRDQKNTDYLLNRAELRIQLGKTEKAREDLDRLVSLGVPRPALKNWYRRLKQ